MQEAPFPHNLLSPKAPHLQPGRSPVTSCCQTRRPCFGAASPLPSLLRPALPRPVLEKPLFCFQGSYRPTFPLMFAVVGWGLQWKVSSLPPVCQRGQCPGAALGSGPSLHVLSPPSAAWRDLCLTSPASPPVPTPPLAQSMSYAKQSPSHSESSCSAFLFFHLHLCWLRAS